MLERDDHAAPSPAARAQLAAERTDLKRETAPTDLAPGTVVDRQFEITGPGVAGGMGVVYPVVHLELREPRALKLMHPYLVADAEAVELFKEEARNGLRLADKGVVRVHHFGDWAGQKYLTMEWVAGGSLRAELRRRSMSAESSPRLPLGIVLPLITKVTEALAYAHGEGVVHLDVKPENILLAPVPQAADYLAGGGRPKLADFGLSKLMSRDQLSQSALAAGTAYYIAPERIEEGGAAGRAHPRMDVFSVGVILYELLCGRLPTWRSRLPHQVDATLPEMLDEIVERCLMDEPGERYQSAGELRAALLVLEQEVAEGGSRRVAEQKRNAAEEEAERKRQAEEAARRAAEGTERRRRAKEAERQRAAGEAERQRQAAAEEHRKAQEAAERARQQAGPRLPADEAAQRDPAEMILIPGGEFLMGSEEYGDEKPPHKVHLDTFEMDKHPVTNARWKRFMEAGGYREQQWWSNDGWEWREQNNVTQPKNWADKDYNGPDQPVVGVSWHEAEAFCRWAGKRLPTEAEWEKAARGTDGRRYPWGNRWDPERANSSERGVRKTAPVGSYPGGASPYGVQDMAGNVWEWVGDWYDSADYKQSPKENPPGPGSGSKKVLRGGSWRDYPFLLRSTNRDLDSPDSRYYRIGFRCARG